MLDKILALEGDVTVSVRDAKWPRVALKSDGPRL